MRIAQPTVYESVAAELCGPTEPVWSALCDAVPELRDLDKTRQSVSHHSEGDVGIHTRLVLSELRADPAWIAKDPAKRAALAWACLMHDIGKPARTKVEEDGSITSRGHSATGDLMARSILWEAGAPIADRELICRVARWHQIPFFAGLKGDEFDIKRLSLSISLEELAICARADARGRTTNPVEARAQTLDSIDLFEMFATDLGVWSAPMASVGPTERGIWLAKDGQYDPSYPWHGAERRPILIAGCGLPGSGKSTVASSLGLPVVGLDWARESLGALHGEQEGEARALAFDALKKYLAAGSSVFFDATNLGSDQRERLCSIATSYSADCVFAHVEAESPKEWRRRNAERAGKSLPKKALDGMLSKWSAPVSQEGSAQVFLVSGQATPAPVWGALDEAGWTALSARALDAAKTPRGKPTGPR